MLSSSYVEISPTHYDGNSLFKNLSRSTQSVSSGKMEGLLPLKQLGKANDHSILVLLRGVSHHLSKEVQPAIPFFSACAEESENARVQCATS